MAIKTPYLIQRATIQNLEGRSATDIPLSKAVSFDYMGSAEFEFGAIPKAFRGLKLNRTSLVLRTVESIKDTDDRWLRVLSPLIQTDWEAYLPCLHKLREGHGHTKDRTEFSVSEQAYIAERNAKMKSVRLMNITDFWWDIENNVMWSFNKNFMSKRLQAHLEASFDVIAD